MRAFLITLQIICIVLVFAGIWATRWEIVKISRKTNTAFIALAAIIFGCTWALWF